MLINACPYGYYGDPVKPCTCAHSIISKYQKRISGPLLDRIDIHVELPRVEYEKLTDDKFGEPSAEIRKRVEAARQIQRERLASTGLSCNADMHPAEIRRFCTVDESGRSLIRTAMNQMQLSARAYHRVLKLVHTIADLAGVQDISIAHLPETEGGDCEG